MLSQRKQTIADMPSSVTLSILRECEESITTIIGHIDYFEQQIHARFMETDDEQASRQRKATLFLVLMILLILLQIAMSIASSYLPDTQPTEKLWLNRGNYISMGASIPPSIVYHVYKDPKREWSIRWLENFRQLSSEEQQRIHGLTGELEQMNRLLTPALFNDDKSYEHVRETLRDVLEVITINKSSLADYAKKTKLAKAALESLLQMIHQVPGYQPGLFKHSSQNTIVDFSDQPSVGETQPLFSGSKV